MAIATQEAHSRTVHPQLEAFLDAAIDGVIVTDAEGRIKLFNHAAERMFGYFEQELIGRGVTLLIPEQYRTRQQRFLLRYLRGVRSSATGTTHELRGERRDGSQFAAEIALGYVNVEPPNVIAFVRDIGERKRSEDLTRQSEAALHLSQELANIGNYVINFDGNAADYASPQLRRIFGWEPDELVSNLAEYVQRVAHPSDRHRVVNAFTRLYAGGGTFDIQYRVLHADTGLRYLHHIAQSIHGPDGRMLQHVGTIHDITERRLVDHEVRQMQDRIAHFGRISTMGEMAAAIAHEVNQPLAAIATFAQSCERLLGSKTFQREELAVSLQQIAAQALRAGEIIRRVRSFSKHRPMQFERIKANRLMEELLVLAQTDAHHHNVRLHFDAAPESPEVRVDAIQVQQVLVNLVRNGIDAMTDVPDARREIILRTRLENDEVEFSVEDCGQGLDSQIVDELFKPFFTTKASGTGLGLAISASIVRAHGGKLRGANNSTGGARFSFSIPAVMTGRD